MLHNYEYLNHEYFRNYNKYLFHELIERYQKYKKYVQYIKKHPEDLEEALNFMSIENNIIQHKFLKDRNPLNKLCYICGEREDNHLKELNQYCKRIKKKIWKC